MPMLARRCVRTWVRICARSWGRRLTGTPAPRGTAACPDHHGTPLQGRLRRSRERGPRQGRAALVVSRTKRRKQNPNAVVSREIKAPTHDRNGPGNPEVKGPPRNPPTRLSRRVANQVTLQFQGPVSASSLAGPFFCETWRADRVVLAQWLQTRTRFAEL